jgi:septal ring factor EnvC (AmiA/AmiB activator)
MKEKELELKNLEKIQQHRLEREQQRRQQEEQRRQQEQQRRQQEELRRQQEELRRQQQEIEARRQREAELREAEAARNRVRSGSGEVFHFQQISTLSTVGQSQQTYAVDRNFIRELEKNLGDNESKFKLFIFFYIISTYFL